jgi:hypothetical protein
MYPVQNHFPCTITVGIKVINSHRPTQPAPRWSPPPLYDGVEPSGAELCVCFLSRNRLNLWARFSASFGVSLGRLNSAPGCPAAEDAVEGRALRFNVTSGMLSGLLSAVLAGSVLGGSVLATGGWVFITCGVRDGTASDGEESMEVRETSEFGAVVSAVLVAFETLGRGGPAAESPQLWTLFCGDPTVPRCSCAGRGCEVIGMESASSSAF